ncbi:MAG: hypothetical protein KJN93_00030 [Alphaproteobacteria bacterium]|nr:hypothetical protein [Alphaproteobacteria bacterium]
MPGLTKTAGVICGCVLGFTIAVEMGDPARPGEPAGFRLGIAQAQAGASIRERIENRKKREAKQRAARDRAVKAERARLKGSRTKELPADCAYDLEGSREAGSDVHLCDGMRYQAIKEPGFEGYEVHPVGVDRRAINKDRARRAKEAAKRRAAAKKRRQDGRVAELPPSCAYDANASIGATTDIYSCGSVLYRAYEEKGERGFEVVNPAGQGGGRASSPGRSSGNRGEPSY